MQPASAQLFENKGELFTETDFFNREFIRDNKIKSIKGTVADKDDLKPIEQLNLRNEYYFDEEGRLKGILEEVASKDTTPLQLITLFEYDATGNVVVKRGSDRDGFFSWRYEYNDDGYMVRETYNRETNKGSSSADFELDRQIKVHTETFEYPVHTDEQQKKVFFNREGREYKTQMRYWGAYGHLTEELEVFTVSNRKTTKTYAYDEMHRLAKRTETSSHGSELVREFDYDDLGFVESEKVLRNGTLIKDIAYMYDPATYMLSARLIRDEEEQSIRIIQYETEFFE